jgi:hypothetical protein
LSGLSAVVNRVDLDKTREFALIGGVEGTYGDAVFEEFTLFGEGFAPESEGGSVFFEGAVNGLPRESGLLGLSSSVFPGSPA